MPLPVILAGTLARLLLKGGMIAARAYAKKNGVRITAAVTKKAKNINKLKKPTKKITSTKANITKKTKTTTKGGKGGPAKVKSNKAETQKPNKTTTNTTKPGTKSFKSKGAAIAGGLVGAALLIKNKSKDKDNKTGRTTSPSSFISSKTKPASSGTKMDDMLDKDVRGVPAGFKNKGSRGRGASGFGNNISFTSKDVKNLKQNAKDLKKQIDGLDITNMQKLRLKKIIDTRDPGYSMGESYSRAFKKVKSKVKNKDLNFAIDVSGYAG